ncbi:flavodoxin domain-containing protein [Candidatus Gottesmanbacteria bacterium]|nr:flavodoxin domain-containing protein [Candidatus Gottesmanbacteria bacterium]
MAKKVLIIYATNSGGTQISSNIIETIFKQKGQDVILKKVSNINPEEFSSFDLIIFGSPSWDYQGKEGQLHQDYLPFLEKAKGKTFPDKKFAVFGLGDSSYTYFCGSATHLENLVKNLNGQKIGDTLRIDGFYFNQDENSKKVEEWATNLANQL